MTDKKITGGNAFPDETSYGMTLLDYFAAQAMKSFLMDESLEAYDEIALMSYQVAEAMLVEKRKREAGK